MYFDAKEFGKRLHDVRTSRGITQEELAVRLGLASKQHVSRMENGERSCSIDLLIELSCILHVSTDYLLMGSEPSKEEVKNDLLNIISELSTIATKSDDTEYGKVSYARFRMLFGFRPASGRESVSLVCPHCRL